MPLSSSETTDKLIDPKSVPGMLAYWDSRAYSVNSYDGSAGILSCNRMFDQTGNSRHMLQPVKVNQPQPIYNYLSFDGDPTVQTNADFLTLASASEIDPNDTVAVFASVFRTGTQSGSFSNILRKHSEALNRGWRLQMDGGGTGFSINVNNSGTAFGAGAFLTTGVAIAAFISGGNVQTFVNGVATTTGTYTPGAGLSSSQPVVVGIRNGVTGASTAQWRGGFGAGGYASGLSADTVKAINLDIAKDWGFI